LKILEIKAVQGERQTQKNLLDTFNFLKGCRLIADESDTEESATLSELVLVLGITEDRETIYDSEVFLYRVDQPEKLEEGFAFWVTKVARPPRLVFGQFLLKACEVRETNGDGDNNWLTNQLEKL
jgi:hypothetical protein